MHHVLLVADETGLPAMEGILAALPSDTKGQALIEIPSAEDRRPIGHAGIDVRWLPREDPTAVPGCMASAQAKELALPDEPFYGWVVGESRLAVELRRHWVKAGAPKDRVMFCGY